MLYPFIARSTLIAVLMGLAPALHAHEFWLAPIAPVAAAGDTVTLRLEVGELFKGEAAGFSIPTSRSLRHFSANKPVEDLRAFLPAKVREAEVEVALDTPGMHLLAYDSAPLRIELEAGRFNAYLHDEGLDFVKTLREQSGTANLPGRERYRRHIKTLIAVGPAPQAVRALDETYAKHASQRLEVTPLHNPLTLAPGEALPVKIVFDDKPLVGALVKAWHKHDGQLVLIRATTSAKGEVAFNLPYTGDWMVSVVHMIPAANSGEEGDEEGVDWDSFWGNLTFHLPSS